MDDHQRLAFQSKYFTKSMGRKGLSAVYDSKTSKVYPSSFPNFIEASESTFFSQQ